MPIAAPVTTADRVIRSPRREVAIEERGSPPPWTTLLPIEVTEPTRPHVSAVAASMRWPESASQAARCRPMRRTRLTHPPAPGMSPKPSSGRRNHASARAVTVVRRRRARYRRRCRPRAAGSRCDPGRRRALGGQACRAHRVRDAGPGPVPSSRDRPRTKVRTVAVDHGPLDGRVRGHEIESFHQRIAQLTDSALRLSGRASVIVSCDPSRSIRSGGPADGFGSGRGWTSSQAWKSGPPCRVARPSDSTGERLRDRQRLGGAQHLDEGHAAIGVRSMLSMSCCASASSPTTTSQAPANGLAAADSTRPSTGQARLRSHGSKRRR